MIKLEIEIDGENKLYDLPSDWNEVTVGIYEDVIKASQKMVNNKIEAVVELLNALCGMNADEVYMLPVDSFNQICDTLNWIKDPINAQSKESIIIDGEEYFIKDEFNKLSMGEVISVETILDKHNNSVEAALSDLLCIFLRKKKDNGKLESFKSDFMNRSAIFKNIMITDIYSVMIFFSSGGSKFINNTKISSDQEIKRNQDSI